MLWLRLPYECVCVCVFLFEDLDIPEWLRFFFGLPLNTIETKHGGSIDL